MQKRLSEYRTKNHPTFNSNVTKTAVRQTDRIPSCLYSPITELAAEKGISIEEAQRCLACNSGATTEFEVADWDKKTKIVTTQKDIDRLLALLAS